MKKNIIVLTFILASIQGCSGSSIPQAAMAMTPMGAAASRVQIDRAVRQGEAYSRAMKQQQKMGKVMPMATAPQGTSNVGKALDLMMTLSPYLPF